MSLKDIDVKIEYRSLLHNIANDFYIPVLNKAVSYDRAVGFFSSSILASISNGIDGLARNGGEIRLVTSPYLSEKDKEAIRKGYENRHEVVKNALLRELREPQNDIEQEQLNLLANLISDGILDIRIAFTEDTTKLGMYHEKLGLIRDSDGNVIAFSGSMNESENALSANYETIDVFCSWKGDQERIAAKENAFQSIWNDTEPNLVVLDFPEIKTEIINKYKRENLDYSHSPSYYRELIKYTIPGAKIPDGFVFHDYQKKAIDTWVHHNYCGIFDMATGTGKTYTGLGAISRLNIDLRGHLAVVIVAPYQHLVEQWVEDIEKFGMKPIIGYSSSSQKDWKNRLENAIRRQKLNVKGAEFFCFICTNVTYSSKFVQETINKIKGDCLLVVDEAHNFGAINLRKYLNPIFNYRLALSATLERHNDEAGTEALYSYFGDKCIEYTLEMAIDNGFLTKYHYHPIFVNLTDEELTDYYKLTKSIQQCIKKGKDGKYTITEQGKRLTLKRSRLVSAAQNKLYALRQEISPFVAENHILVYCGSASLKDFHSDTYPVDEDEIRQIDAVTDLLGNQLNMRVSQYTSREDIEERKILKEQFANGDILQALIAIKCLDEGVNIPSIKIAFILASTTNPKEYVQRRGRVLRLYEGKQYAEIYDFITLPQKLGNAYSATEAELKIGLELVRNELKRAFEFARLADNYVEADLKLQRIRDVYNITDEISEIREDFDYYD